MTRPEPPERCPNQPREGNDHPPASVQFGARLYCPACAGRLRSWLDEEATP